VPPYHLLYAPVIWGKDHPDFGKKRARFSVAELAYMSKLIQRFDANDCINFVSICLRLIREDPDAIDIFHERHVVDSARLRSGFRTHFQLK
jgi:hypothetical protein